MFRRSLTRDWFLQPTKSLYTKSLYLNQPYRCVPNTNQPLKAEVDLNEPAAPFKLATTIESEKLKLQQDIQSLKKNKFMSWNDFSNLTKFKLSLMNTWVAATGYFMTNKCLLTDWSDIGFLLLAAQLSAMSSQSMNQALEVEHDKKMLRTMHRPLPAGKISNSAAVSLSWALLGASNMLLYSFFGWQAGAVANAIFASYILIYTPMKRTSEKNTHWGSLVGAVVPYLGWFAGGGSALSLSPFFVCLFIYAWQFPHFYGILWTYKDDYKRGGYKMLEDPQVAARHAKLAVAGYLASTIGLIATGDISIFSSIPAGYSYWKYGWKPAQEFAANPTLENAKKMKYGSYWPFTIFMGAVILGIMQRVYMHEYHQKLLPEELKEQEVKKTEEMTEEK